jgi:hypothetical protein
LRRGSTTEYFMRKLEKVSQTYVVYVFRYLEEIADGKFPRGQKFHNFIQILMNLSIKLSSVIAGNELRNNAYIFTK